MKFRYSCISRRRFLSWLGGGWFAAFVASLVYPIFKAVIPPYREPDEVSLPMTEFSDLQPNSVKYFAWGIKPGIIKKNDDESLVAFLGVCTHLDCNVQYLPEKRKFFCACHDGWYDETGINIGGPPPRPLRRLFIYQEGDQLIIRREEKA